MDNIDLRQGQLFCNSSQGTRFNWCLGGGVTEAYSELSQIFKMRLYAKIVNSRKPYTIFEKGYLTGLDIWQGSEYATELKKVKELPQNEMKFYWYHIFYFLSLSIDFRIGMSGWFNEEKKKILKMNFVLVRMKVYKNEFSFGISLVFSIFYISRVIITFQSYLQRNNE